MSFNHLVRFIALGAFSSSIVAASEIPVSRLRTSAKGSTLIKEDAAKFTMGLRRSQAPMSGRYPANRAVGEQHLSVGDVARKFQEGIQTFELGTTASQPRGLELFNQKDEIELHGTQHMSMSMPPSPPQTPPPTPNPPPTATCCASNVVLTPPCNLFEGAFPDPNVCPLDGQSCCLNSSGDTIECTSTCATDCSGVQCFGPPTPAPTPPPAPNPPPTDDCCSSGVLVFPLCRLQENGTIPDPSVCPENGQSCCINVQGSIRCTSSTECVTDCSSVVCFDPPSRRPTEGPTPRPTPQPVVDPTPMPVVDPTPQPTLGPDDREECCSASIGANCGRGSNGIYPPKGKCSQSSSCCIADNDDTVRCTDVEDCDLDCSSVNCNLIPSASPSTSPTEPPTPMPTKSKKGSKGKDRI